MEFVNWKKNYEYKRSREGTTSLNLTWNQKFKHLRTHVSTRGIFPCGSLGKLGCSYNALYTPLFNEWVLSINQAPMYKPTHLRGTLLFQSLLDPLLQMIFSNGFHDITLLPTFLHIRKSRLWEKWLVLNHRAHSPTQK